MERLEIIFGMLYLGCWWLSGVGWCYREGRKGGVRVVVVVVTTYTDGYSEVVRVFFWVGFALWFLFVASASCSAPPPSLPVAV